MNAEGLLKVYEQISDAPDAVARLRRFVLDLAVRGKLVAQNAGDEPAAELLQAFRTGKLELRKKTGDARIKFAEDATPSVLRLDLPSGWEVQSFENLFLFIDYRGKTPPKTEAGIPLITAKNVRKRSLNREPREFIAPDTFAKWMTRGFPRLGDIFFTTEAPLANACLNDIDEPFALAQRVVCLQPYAAINTRFLVDAMASDLVQAMIDREATGMTAKGIKTAKLKPLALPVPPLAEQHRIVAKVDELMGLCDRLEAARLAREEVRDKLTAASVARLTAPEPGSAETLDQTTETSQATGNTPAAPIFQTHARFALEALPALTSRPDQIKSLRQTILNLAVRGKLVEQDPADEPAADLLDKIGATKGKQKAREAASDNLPFSVPDGWASASVRDSLQPDRDISYGVIKLGNEPKSGGIPTLRCSDVRPGYIETRTVRKVQEEIEAQYARTRLEGGEVLINIRGTLGGVAEVPKALAGYNIAREVAVIPVSQHILAQYIVYLMLSPFFWDHIQSNLRGIAYKGLNLGTLRTLPIPIPPLAEQHRIVAKVDALMALCDRLEAALITAETSRTRLLNALLHEALTPATPIPEAAE